MKPKLEGKVQKFYLTNNDGGGGMVKFEGKVLRHARTDQAKLQCADRQWHEMTLYVTAEGVYAYHQTLNFFCGKDNTETIKSSIVISAFTEQDIADNLKLVCGELSEPQEKFILGTLNGANLWR